MNWYLNNSQSLRLKNYWHTIYEKNQRKLRATNFKTILDEHDDKWGSFYDIERSV